MKLIWKRKAAYVLALILGVTGIWGGTVFSLPSMTSDMSEVYAASATVSNVKATLEADNDKWLIKNGETATLTATIKFDSEGAVSESDLTNLKVISSRNNGIINVGGTMSVSLSGKEFTVKGITAKALTEGAWDSVIFTASLCGTEVDAWCYIEIEGDSTARDSDFEKGLSAKGTTTSNYGSVMYGIDKWYGSTSSLPDISFSLNSSTANTIIAKLLKNNYFNENEVSALNNKTAQIYLYIGAYEMKSEYLSSTANTLIKNKLSSGHTIGKYLGLDFMAKTGTNAEKDDEDETVPNTGSDVSITIDTSSIFPSISSGKTREYGVIRLHYDESSDKLTATNLSVSSSSQKITFSSSKFSTFVLTYKDTTSSSTATTVSSTRGSSSSDDDDDDDDDSSSKKRGSGSAKGYYTKTSSSTARYDGSALSYKATKATVPATIKLGGKVRNVTSVASYAFFGYEKLTSVTIGKNVKRIGQYAFADCKKLKTITINSKKLTKKGVKNSLKDSSVTTILVPKDKVKAYKKIFTQKNTGSKGKITVKAKK